jgi:hypothetical protein
MNPKYLILSLDFDGCSDRPFSQQEIINHVKKTCLENPTIESIYLIIGSLRQTAMLDVGNAQRNSEHPHYLSCTTLYDVFLGQLHRRISKLGLERTPSVHFCPLLMNDIYNHLETGSTFKAMQNIFTWPSLQIARIQNNTHELLVRNQRGENINILSDASNKEIADCSKVTLIYTQMHHFAKHLDAAPILMQFYDDRLDILSGLQQFYTSAPKLMPENIHLQLICQKALKGVQPTLYNAEPIKGQGEINQDYHELMYQMAEYHKWCSIPDAFDNHQAIFESLLANPLPSTHAQTFVLYSVPVLDEPTPSISARLVSSITTASESMTLDYHEIIVPVPLPPDMSIYNCYQDIMTKTLATYQKKLKDAKQAFEADIDYLVNLPEYRYIFSLAYELEKTQRHHMEVYQMQEELEDLLAKYDEEYRLETDCKFYASRRCDFDEQQQALKYAFVTAKKEKIQLLAKSIQLSPQVFIERMERHQSLLETTTTVLVAPRAIRPKSILKLKDDHQTTTLTQCASIEKSVFS